MKGGEWADIRFEPTPANDLTDFVRKNYRLLYHLTPSVFESSIKKSGLVPSNNNSEFKYNEPRVYLMRGDASLSEIQALANTLYRQAKAFKIPKMTNIYCLFTVNIENLPDDTIFYGDINEPQGIFVTIPIPKEAIVDEKYIKAIDDGSKKLY